MLGGGVVVAVEQRIQGTLTAKTSTTITAADELVQQPRSRLVGRRAVK
jgi:hypothetical protein